MRKFAIIIIFNSPIYFQTFLTKIRYKKKMYLKKFPSTIGWVRGFYQYFCLSKFSFFNFFKIDLFIDKYVGTSKYVFLLKQNEAIEMLKFWN